MLSIGKVLKVPANVEEPEISNTYVVRKGDTLYKIAQNFDTTVNEIMNLNNLTSTILSIGQILNIPISSINTYTVKKGDTLYKIAKDFNVAIDDIIRLNNLTSTILSIGQILRIK